MPTFTNNQKYLAQCIARNDLQAARRALLNVLAEDTSQKNAGFVSETIAALKEKPELPAAYEGILLGGYVSDGEISRYYCTGREKAAADTIIRMHAAAEKLGEMHIHYTNAALLYGPSGCGKTMFAKYVAHRMGLPMYFVNFASAVDSLLGGTAKNIGRVFRCAKEIPCVLLLDEIDCVALKREGHGQKGPDGELERTTISIMQNLDELPNSAVVIAATNRSDIIDPALMRRFTQKYEVAAPAAQEAGKIVDLFFSSIGQENPYPESAAEEMYRESGGTPAALMAKVVQSLAEQIAAEESACAQEKS